MGEALCSVHVARKTDMDAAHVSLKNSRAVLAGLSVAVADTLERELREKEIDLGL